MSVVVVAQGTDRKTTQGESLRRVAFRWRTKVQEDEWENTEQKERKSTKTYPSSQVLVVFYKRVK